MSGIPKEFFEDAHDLMRKIHEVLERVCLTGDGNAMPTIEANAVARDAAIKEAGESVRDGLTQVSQALGQIADELAAARRERERNAK